MLRPQRRLSLGMFCLSELRVLFHCLRSHLNNYSYLEISLLRDSLFYRGCVATRHLRFFLSYILPPLPLLSHRSVFSVNL